MILRQKSNMAFLGFMVLVIMEWTALPGLAQDQIGIFWDEGYSERSAVCTSPNQVVEGYLVIENPSVGGGILGWECEVTLKGPAYFVGWSFPGQALNLEPPPRFNVGYLIPLPSGSATSVATFQLFVTEVEPVWLGLTPLSGVWPERTMSYRAADQPEIQIALSTLIEDEFIACVDDQPPVFLPEPEALDLGHVAIGTVAHSGVTVTNAGGGLLWLDPYLGCSNDEWESRFYSGPITLGAGKSNGFGVSYHAEVMGESLCSLHFGPQFPVIALSATAGEPRYDWETSDPLDFELAVGKSKSGWITIKNTGDLPLELDVGLSGDVDQIEISRGADTLTLDPLRTHWVSVVAHSWTTGEFGAEVDFGPELPSVPVTAIVAYLDSFTYSVSQDSLDFGVGALETASTLSIDVTNTGFVNFSVVPVVEPAGTAFSLVEEGVVIPVPGLSRPVRIYVDFRPTFEGHQEAVLVLGEGLPQIPLLGQGAAAGYHCGVQPDSMDFGSIEVGDWIQRNLLVANEGSMTLELTPQSTSPEFIVDSTHRSLETGNIAIIPLWFAPYLVGDFVGAIDLGPEACSDIVVMGSATDSGLPIALPSPAVLVDRRMVELTWTPHLSGADGYHVWRRGPEEHSVLLTIEPLAPLDNMQFTDEPAIALGTTLHYCYAALISGEEIGRSPETTVTLPDVPLLRSQLLGAAPNPFNPETNIRFTVGEPGPVNIAVYDMKGRWLRTLVDRHAEAENMIVRWDGKDETGRLLPSGSYIIRLETVDRIDSKKVTMLK